MVVQKRYRPNSYHIIILTMSDLNSIWSEMAI